MVQAIHHLQVLVKDFLVVRMMEAVGLNMHRVLVAVVLVVQVDLAILLLERIPPMHPVVEERQTI